MQQETLLLWLVLAPILGGFACFFTSEKLARRVALSFSLIGCCLALVLWWRFNPLQAYSDQFAFIVPWISAFHIRFALAVDGLSLPLVVLTKLMVPIAILASWKEERRVRTFMICYLWLDSAMTGTFLATDIFLFYVFWEMMLIPMILIIGIWGSTDRVYAALKFFIFTFAGSVLMLVAIFWLLSWHHTQFGYYSTEIKSLYRLTFPKTASWFGLNAQEWIFLAFTLAFAIKVPLFPVHTWLPDAHVQAPTGGSILLAAVLLKMGTYGLLRFSIPIGPDAFVRFLPYLATLSVIGILYGACVAFQQTDMKKLVAYSSVSHLGFAVLGICAANTEGLTGSMLQMVNHGFSTGALFLLVGILYERRHSRNFADFGGIADVMPWYAFFLIFVGCASMAVPGLNGFVGEFLILFGTFRSNPVWASWATLGVIFGAAYTLMMIRRVLFGPITSAENRTLKDLNQREWLALVPLCIIILILGLYPKLFLQKIEVSLESYWRSVQKTNSAITEHSRAQGKAS